MSLSASRVAEAFWRAMYVYAMNTRMAAPTRPPTTPPAISPEDGTLAPPPAPEAATPPTPATAGLGVGDGVAVGVGLAKATVPFMRFCDCVTTAEYVAGACNAAGKYESSTGAPKEAAKASVKVPVTCLPLAVAHAATLAAMVASPQSKVIREP